MTSQLSYRRGFAASLVCAASLLVVDTVAAQYYPPGGGQAGRPYPGVYGSAPAAYPSTPVAYPSGPVSLPTAPVAGRSGPVSFPQTPAYPPSRLATAQVAPTFPEAGNAGLPAVSQPALGQPLAQQVPTAVQPTVAAPSDAPVTTSPVGSAPVVTGLPQAGYPQAGYPVGVPGQMGVPQPGFSQASNVGAATGAAAGNNWAAAAGGATAGCNNIFDPWANYTPIGGCGRPWGRKLGHVGGLYGAAGNCGTGASADGCATGCCPPCAPPCRAWFGGVYGLYMDHDAENPVWLSFDSTVLDSIVLGSQDAHTDWHPGAEIRFGTTFISAPLAWEVVYWGLVEQTDSATATATQVGNPISTSLDFSGLDYDGAGVNSYYDNVEAHQVRRHFELHNVELNLIMFPILGCGPCGVACGNNANTAAAVSAYANGASFGGLWGAGAGYGPKFTVAGTAGVRYIRLDEGLRFAASTADATFGDDPTDINYNIEMENHFVGGQIGCAANYQCRPRLSFFSDARLGVYNNHVRHFSRIHGTQGSAVVAAGLPYAGQAFAVSSSKDDVAFVGELRLGMAFQVRPHWRLYGGWRAVAISGIALPTNQIPMNFGDIPGVRIVDTNGSMVLHGLQFGAEINY